MIIKNDPDTIENYLTDASNLRGKAEEVIIPENEFELIETIRELYSRTVPYTISGAGTGLVGGRVPFEGVIISMEKINTIFEVNDEEQTIHLQGGVAYSEMDYALNEHKLFLPPNPTEKNAFVGANIACNSSGSRTFKYGTFRDFVQVIKVILPDGEVVELTRNDEPIKNNIYMLPTPSGKVYSFTIPKITYPTLKKNSAGYYLRDGMHKLDLFIGSEGTIGTILEAKLRLIPFPEKVLGLIIFFEKLEKSLDFVDEIRNRSYISFHTGTNSDNLISARLIEYFDRNSLSLLFDEYPQIPKNSFSAIWIEQEYIEKEEEALIKCWFDIISKYTSLVDDTWVAMTDNEHERFRVFRHRIPQRVFELVARSKYQKVGSDVSVPDSMFKNYYLSLVETLYKSEIQFFIWGHIGNSHIHANLIPTNEEQNQLANEIYDDIVHRAIQLGGTFSAEHGTGKLKRKYLEMMYGSEVVAQMKKIKLLFDPKNLVGRGNLFF
ncbi:MAG: FAD-binding oxidoreductase [Candidatus Kapaibacteriales bacterium]